MVNMKKAGVHIVPTGVEFDRAILPLLKDFTVQKAYMIIHKPKGEPFTEQTAIVNKYIEKMKSIPIEWEEVYTDIYDFDDTFTILYNLIHKELKAGNPVYVNISSAPRIVQVALIFAAFLNRKEDNVELFYVEPVKYFEGDLMNAVFELLEKDADEKKIIQKIKATAKEIRDHGIAMGEKKIHEFPPFPIAKVTDIEHDILKVLVDNKKVDSIKDMKELLDKERGEPTPRSNIKYYLDNMSRLGLIKTEREMKELRIMPTRVGELFAKTRELPDNK